MMYSVYGGLLSLGVVTGAQGSSAKDGGLRPAFFITPCLSFDRVFWSARGVGQLCLFSSPLPVGQALALVKRLNEEWQAHVGLCREKNIHGVSSKNEDVNKNFVAGTGDPAFFIACFAEFARRYGWNGSSGECRADSCADAEGDAYTYAGADAEVDWRVKFGVRGDGYSQLDDLEREAAAVFPLLAGRALWLEEVVSAVSSRLTDGQTGWQDGGQSVERKVLLLLQYLYLSGNLQIRSGVEKRAGAGSGSGRRCLGWLDKLISHFIAKKERYLCQRCGAEEKEEILVANCANCNQSCAYCTRCITMGRSRSCKPLFLFSRAERKEDEDLVSEEEKGSALPSHPLQIKLQLTPRQEYAAQKAVELLSRGNSAAKAKANADADLDELLIWAVCGAGKTEVIYPVINEALLRGQQVLITTPRKDVVLELGPRVARAFPLQRTVVLHGSSVNKWENGDITIATTHQLLRFYQRFDLVILDEVDAFPYHNNPMLYRAVRGAAARGRERMGKIVYLSATPPATLLRRLGRKSGRVVKIPARYHGHPLPVPKLILQSPAKINGRLTGERMHGGGLIIGLDPFFKRVIAKGRQAFVFVPYVEDVELVREYICRHYAEIAPFTAGVHSRDAEREQKVLRFREGSVRLLVTTTVLERGVTVPGTDVLVWNSDSALFDEASLVQIAGRAGRSAADPDGWVWFVAARRTRAQVAAIRHIREMNRLANRLGLLGGNTCARQAEEGKTG